MRVKMRGDESEDEEDLKDSRQMQINHGVEYHLRAFFFFQVLLIFTLISPHLGGGRVPFNEPYAPSLSTIYDGA